MTLLYLPYFSRLINHQSLNKAPNLSRWLRQATRRVLPNHSAELRNTWDLSCHCLGLPKTLPHAPLRALADNCTLEKSYWITADPVILIADAKTLFLKQFAPVTLDQTALFADLTQLLTPLDMKLITPTSQHWYLQSTSAFNADDGDPYLAMGKALSLTRARQPLRSTYPALLTEMQMLLHLHQQAANSLWCWGAGQLPAETSISKISPHARVWTDDLAIQGLAQYCAIPCLALENLRKNPQEIQQQDIIIYRHYDHSTSEETLLHLDQHVFAPLLMSLQQKKLVELELLFDNGYSYALNKRHLYYFWRRRVDLTNVIP